MPESDSNPKAWSALFGGFFISLFALAGSLFFSEVLHYSPCVLCWYQRIALFPLPIILGVGYWLRDFNVWKYASPFAFGGLLLAGYHNLLYYGVISEALSPCTEGSSCKAVHINWFGFVSIPLLSLLAFALSSGCLLYFWLGVRREHEAR